MTSFLIRVRDQPHLRHDRVQFFVGVDPDHRQLAGEITLRPEEVNDLLRATGAKPKHSVEPGPHHFPGDWVFTV